MSTSRHKLGSRRQPDKTRAEILRAAMQEFAYEGVAGARTDAIAKAARVNKALLYYYFKDKETLYGAILDQVFGGLTSTIRPILESNLPPRQKVLAYAGAHFDYVAASPMYPRVVQWEMMRSKRGGTGQLRRIAQTYFQPTYRRLAQVLREGIAAGEFREVDPMHFIPSMIAVIVFYFSSLPVVQALMPGDPLSAERIRERRAAVLDFISAALFAAPRQEARRAMRGKNCSGTAFGEARR